MKCPLCQKQMNTYDSRPVSGAGAQGGDYGPHRWRRRECSGCGERFTTREFIESDLLDLVSDDVLR